jgi:hypothetical protein
MLLFKFAPFVKKQTTKKLSVVEFIVKQAGHFASTLFAETALWPPQLITKLALKSKRACLTIAD